MSGNFFFKPITPTIVIAMRTDQKRLIEELEKNLDENIVEIISLSVTLFKEFEDVLSHWDYIL